MEGKKNLVFFLSLFLLVGKLESHPQPNGCCSVGGAIEKKHFVLVHGAGLGGWCWYKLATLLRSAGHNVTALDLAASGIDPKQAKELRSVSEYFEPLMKFMDSVPTKDKVILVGHSFGGLGLSIAMESFPEKISVAVFVTAGMPGPALNISTFNKEASRRQDSQTDNRFTYDDGPDNPPTTTIFGPKFMSSKVLQLSPPEDLTLANMLVRPMRVFSAEDMSNVIVLSKEKYGSVGRVYVISKEDMAIKEDFQRWMIKHNPPDEVKQITGSDHMVMISKPQELCAVLQGIAENYS